MRSAALVFVCILVLSTPAFAQVPAHIEYSFSGTGNLMTSPVIYSGTVDSGEPLLVGGDWFISIDDTGWPSDSDKNTRWSYVDAAFFTPNFNPYVFSWTGVFNSSTTASIPQWSAGNDGVGDLVGTAEVQLTIQDFNFDMVIQPDERMLMLLSGTIIVVKNGTGIWAGYCGLGSYSGSTENADPWNFTDDSVTGDAVLDIEDCSLPTETVTWGKVKATYRN
ncbi:MAG: hypothetical protein JSW50_07365 [Candidatus Latescibacterota bacterium]|nr:MAG: hypothetical protein JSW50_07365 [Candidatus Latescibacterota bacterium]